MSENKPISGRMLMELADVWENESIDAAHPERRACLREHVDTLRTLAGMPRVDITLSPERSPTHRCTVCGAFWMEWAENWSLCSNECGQCCDNSPDFVDKLAPLVVSDIYTRSDRITALIAAGDRLAGFAGHDDECDWADRERCECGLTDALKAWRKETGHE
jgi:hypothetical protein